MRTRLIRYLAIVMLVCGPVLSQTHDRDPLTDKEVDQLRETAMEPDKRLKLMIEFTKARMVALGQVRSDPKMAKDRGQRIHDLLEDIATLVDEVDDNLEDYNQRSADLRKPLQQIVQMNSDFQVKLRELKAATEDPDRTAETDDYKFALQDAIESVHSSAESSRKLLEEQNTKFAAAKKKK
jgi:hypothetical protein